MHICQGANCMEEKLWSILAPSSNHRIVGLMRIARVRELERRAPGERKKERCVCGMNLFDSIFYSLFLILNSRPGQAAYKSQLSRHIRLDVAGPILRHVIPPLLMTS